MTNSPVDAVPYAWWRRDDYARVVEISADTEKLCPNFRAWRIAAKRGFDELRQQGLPVVKVMIDPEELLAWAIAEERDIDGTARAEFAAIVCERQTRQTH